MILYAAVWYGSMALGCESVAQEVIQPCFGLNGSVESTGDIHNLGKCYIFFFFL